MLTIEDPNVEAIQIEDAEVPGARLGGVFMEKSPSRYFELVARTPILFDTLWKKEIENEQYLLSGAQY